MLRTLLRSSLHTNAAAGSYDVFVVGGGITGSALAYSLSAFTNLGRIGLCERRGDFGTVASGPNNNSQTIHCGDIETNYTLQKARSVKRQADMLRNFATKFGEGTVTQMQKMVIGVGEAEAEAMEKRFHLFKEHFPNMRLIERREIRQVEPAVMEGRPRNQLVNAIYIPNEHSAVNYHKLTRALLKKAEEEAAATGKRLDISLRTEVKNVVADENDDSYTLYTTKGKIHTKYLLLAGCGYSLLFAHKLGYGLKYGCLPIAGSFYFAKTPVLKGKVYTVQNPKLPFAAVHGDPDVEHGGKTRFGPTALPLPLLERYNWESLPDWWSVAGLGISYATVMAKLMADPTMIAYMARNFAFEAPYIGDRLFVKDARKIVPNMQLSDVAYAEGFGGVRPQLVDKQNKKLLMGEGKIKGKNAIFNITPSPGGTTCLGNAELDTRAVCEALGAEFDENKFTEHLIDGEYIVSTDRK